MKEILPFSAAHFRFFPAALAIFSENRTDVCFLPVAKSRETQKAPKNRLFEN